MKGTLPIYLNGKDSFLTLADKFEVAEKYFKVKPLRMKDHEEKLIFITLHSRMVFIS